MISTQKIKLFASYLISLLTSIIAFIPVIAGIIGTMVIFVGENFILVYAFWNFLGTIFEILNVDKNQSIFYFQGFLRIGDNLDEVILFISLLLIVFGLLIFTVGVVQIAIAKKQDLQIISNYLYGYIRHPQVEGIILVSIGIFLYIPTTWPDLKYSGDTNYYIRIGDLYSLFLFILVWLIEAFYEEKALTFEYGEIYQTYKENTPFMIPFSTNVTKFLSKKFPSRIENIPFLLKVLVVIFLYRSIL